MKLRAGQNGDVEFLTRFVQGLEQAGASWIALHPRTAEQMRRGSADWSQIPQIRAKVKMPVIGNGDVQTADDVIRMLEETGCDAAMVGRALTARPWLLWQVGEKLGFAPPKGRTGLAPSTPEEEGAEYGRALLRLLQYVRIHFEESLGLRKFRFFVKTGSNWLLFGHQLYASVMKAKTLDETYVALERFFAMPQPMSARTELRQ